MDQILLFFAQYIYYLFIVNSKWLIEERPYKIIFWISILFASLGIFRGLKFSNLYGWLLLLPIIALLLYRGMRKIFIKKYGRNPISTYMTFHWEKGMLKDVVFSVIFTFLYGAVFAIIIFCTRSMSR